MVGLSEQSGTETQRTLFGGEVEKSTESAEESDEPAVKDCDICGRETVLDGEYLFSRPAEGTLSIPTELWLDDDVDWFESQGVRP